MKNLRYLVNISRVLGVLLMPFSATMLPPILVALWYKEETIPAFVFATVTTLMLGIILWFPFRGEHKEIQPKEAFLIVTLLWLALSFTGTFPFAFSANPNMSFLDAFFETISGLTTTGATVLSDLDTLPRSILYYRQQLQFIGGGGIIVLSIAILPMLSIGGMQLFRAEITGPFKEDKLSPRITQTAKTLWFIYLGLVILCALSYWAGGMSLFDAIGHSFSTISTGGFGTHDANFEFFQSPLLEWMAVIFMLLGAINFSLHFSAIYHKDLLHYWKDPELKMFLIFWFSVVCITGFALFYHPAVAQSSHTIAKTFFQVTAFFTTTGFCNTDFYHWPTFVLMLLFLICLVGGCAGSTAGGIKMIRLLILKRIGEREIKRLIHPSGHYLIKLGNSCLQSRTLEAIMGFFLIFIAIFVVIFLLLLMMGLDPITAFATLTASISNTGLGFGAVPESFQDYDDSVKILMSIAMLAGRLELFTLLVLLTPNYWRY